MKLENKFQSLHNYIIDEIAQQSEKLILSEQDFSAFYSHDLHGNLTHITRKGMLVNLGMGSGTCADIGLSLDGNRISSLSVSDVDDNALEGQPQVRDTGDGFTYDADGNMTRDPSRGIAGIEWNVIDKPSRVTFETGEEIVYRYSATGEKLSEEYRDAGGAVLRRRDYIGNSEFVDGRFDRRQVEGGYLDGRDTYHVYVGDYQGNVLGVVNTATGETEQYTDYYPYGLPHATAYAPEVSRRKFGGKEYTTEFGFNSCDFGARLHSPLHGSFISPDPKAGEYTHISPYAYCASDPVNFIDPSGMVIIFVNGLDGFFSDSAGKPYWTFNSKDYSFVNGATKFFNDKKLVIRNSNMEQLRVL